MVEILNPKIPATTGLIDFVAVGASKQLTEMILSPMIGNATIKSGIIKMILGGVIHSMGKGNKWINIVSGGILVDASEDIAVSTVVPMLKGVMPGMGGNETQANPFGL